MGIIKKTQNESDANLAHLYDDKLTAFKYPKSGISFHRTMNSQPMPILNSFERGEYKKRASAIENDFGYPRVHRVYKMYREQKRVSCSKKEILVLFGKKNGINISYSETSKYFKTRIKTKKINQYRRSSKKYKQNKITQSRLFKVLNMNNRKWILINIMRAKMIFREFVCIYSIIII